jgi:hypothetical protein
MAARIPTTRMPAARMPPAKKPPAVATYNPCTSTIVTEDGSRVRCGRASSRWNDIVALDWATHQVNLVECHTCDIHLLRCTVRADTGARCKSFVTDHPEDYPDHIGMRLFMCDAHLTQRSTPPSEPHARKCLCGYIVLRGGDREHAKCHESAGSPDPIYIAEATGQLVYDGTWSADPDLVQPAVRYEDTADRGGSDNKDSIVAETALVTDDEFLTLFGY